MAGVQEEHRRRIALALIGLGALLILVGLGLGLHHYHAVAASREGPSPSTAPAVQLSRHEQARVIQQVLVVLLVLVGVLGVSLYAFKLWSRRFRQMLMRKPMPPTPSEDVWAMHRLPEDSQARDHRWPEGPEQDLKE